MPALRWLVASRPRQPLTNPQPYKNGAHPKTYARPGIERTQTHRAFGDQPGGVVAERRERRESAEQAGQQQ